MKVLVVGGGGREHALVWKLARSPLVEAIYCAPGNPGTAQLAHNLEVSPGSVHELADAAEQQRIDLTVVGPELSLGLGIADEFERRGLTLFGPGQAAARIETSKVFAKQFMSRHGIPTAEFSVHEDSREARRTLEERQIFPVVVKADGLAAGKGVTVAGTRQQALEAVEAIMVEKRFGAAGERVVIEEFLEGREVSFFALTDGTRLQTLPTCRDYKAALDGDRGPNTGGMGAFSPSADSDEALSQEIVEKILRPTIDGMAQEGYPYRGVLFAGLILTDDGPRVLEFNARFGDPETQVLLPRLESDLAPLLLACARGELTEAPAEWSPDVSVCVVLASRGYPDSPEVGVPIDGIPPSGEIPGIEIFHAGTRTGADGVLLTGGGRVLNVVARGINLEEARGTAYRAIASISFPGMQFREDIARTTESAEPAVPPSIEENKRNAEETN